MCMRSEKPRQLRCSLTNCSLLCSYFSDIIMWTSQIFFFLFLLLKKENKQKMGQRKDPTPSVHSLSSASEVSSASTSSIHKRSTPKIAAIIIVAFLVISSLAGVTVYFITSEKLLMANSRAQGGRNTVVEKRIDELSFFDNNNDISSNSAQWVIFT